MARPIDPFRTLELPRDATLEDVKAAYRRLAKLYHPDSGGERAVPRFLAVQAAYEALTEGPGRLRSSLGSRARPASTAAAGSAARTRTAREGTAAASAPGSARGAGARADDPGAPGPGPARERRGGSAGRPTADGDAGPAGRGGASRARSADGPRPRRTKRAPGSTSYDGAETEPFEPEWEGASWYGGSSGTYWTINPREWADPRKHGPEYLARAQAEHRAGAQRGAAGEAHAPAPGPGEVPPTDGAEPAEPAAAPPPPESAGGRRVWDVGWEDVPRHSSMGRAERAARVSRPADDPPWSPREGHGDVSPFTLIAMSLFALLMVGVVLTLLGAPAAPGPAWLMPLVAFSGIAIVGLVRLFRRDGPPRA